MTLALLSGSFLRGAPTALLRALAVVALLLLLPRQAHPQGVPTLQDLELAYHSARNVHELAVQAWVLQDRRMGQALAEVESANAGGDEDRINRAYARFRREAVQLQSWELDVDRRAEELAAARESYLAALREERRELAAQRDRAVDPQELAELEVLLGATNNKVQDLILGSPMEQENDLPVLSEITISRLDSPEDIRGKAGLLDHRANQYEAQLVEMTRILEELREDQRWDRAARDALADRERFGATRPPVVPPPAGGVNPPDRSQLLPPGTDTTGVAARPLTLDERIAVLEASIVELADYVQQVRDRAAFFRSRAGGEWAW